METKNILGLDLGTNSIGWAVVEKQNAENCDCNRILGSNSRIIPMDANMQSDFAKGNSISQTAERTRYRSVRRLVERGKLRRERLHRVLAVMGFLPKHYEESLTRYGSFKKDVECKLAWEEDENGKPRFLFMESYDEMLKLFWQENPELLSSGRKIPYDWTLYYLRKKALTEAITPQELAWILLNFNQKRGYYQTRNLEEEEKKDNVVQEYLQQQVVDVVEDTGSKNGATWYMVHLESGMIYPCKSKEAPNWIGKKLELIATTYIEKDGSRKLDKDGNVKINFKKPGEDDWGLIKIKTQNDIIKSHLTVGAYIFNSLLKNPSQKIKGKLVRTIERDFYKEEICNIIEAQKQFIPQLLDKTLYKQSIDELYSQNDAYRNSISMRDFTYLLVDDILFYQRPLKSKKSLIDDCPYEGHACRDAEGNAMFKHNKCIAKSHPLFQEFRLWQFVDNLRIFESTRQDDGRFAEVDITQSLLPDKEAVANLFDYLNNLSKIKQESLLTKYFKFKKLKNKEFPYRWNYVQDREYPCNETRGGFLSQLKKNDVDTSFLNPETVERLWHLLYSISDEIELKKALRKFADKYVGLDDREKFVESMVKYPAFKSEYGAYSAKAIKKLLPVMRQGHHWDEARIDHETRERIGKIISGEADDSIANRVRDKAMALNDIADFQGLPIWLACYVVYNRHSEATSVRKWESPEDIDLYLQNFKQFSLRNPIVEQIVTETLRVVRDIWRQYGHIDEIHLEMGRDLKNPADKRKKISEQVLKNENANQRIKALLLEFMNPDYCIENVRPYSPSQQELLRIYEDTVLNDESVVVSDDIKDILNKFNQSESSKRPSHKEILRYKLWLEQQYKSPYTGQAIPLARLFTADYEIEHVIPQSKYFDDSFTNKVICEAEVNKLKDNALGFEFIKKHHGEIVQLSGGRTVNILEVDAYCNNVEETYKHNPAKRKKLLMDEIPDEFIERQLNDSRYISKFIKSLLSNIVREEGENEATSKNLIVCSGSVTDRLKKDWGINEVWNRIVMPRFERMNKITGSSEFTTTTSEGHVVPAVPFELQKGFNKKRIDHRHHAMDAIVIACTTREHVNLISNEATSSKNNAARFQLSHKLRRYEDVVADRNGERKTISVAKEFKMPWQSFPKDVETALNNAVVSFKQNLRVINKTSNYYCHYKDGKKIVDKQTKGDSWAIRKPMHKETVFGEVNLRKIKCCRLKEALLNPQRIVNKDLKEKIKSLGLLNYNEKQIKNYFEEHADEWQDVNLKKIEMYYFTEETSEHYYATRKPIDETYNVKKITEQITDTAIQKIMLRHLAKYDNDAQKAFSPEGRDDMNAHIVELNDGRPHKPIYKVRWCEKGEKFAVGQSGNKIDKYVESAKGTNLFFAVYETEACDEKTGEIVKKRSYRSIPLQEALTKQKNRQPLDDKASFILSPNDLVYVPTKEELQTNKITLPIDTNRIYKMVSNSGPQCFFVKEEIASVIQDKVELLSLNKMERALTEEMIKEICIPIKVDRLGNIIKIYKCVHD